MVRRPAVPYKSPVRQPRPAEPCALRNSVRAGYCTDLEPFPAVPIYQRAEHTGTQPARAIVSFPRGMSNGRKRDSAESYNKLADL